MRAKLLFLGVWLLAFVAAGQVPAYQRGPVTTNAALQRAIAGNALFVSAAYGSDTNAAPGPFATLTYAQGVAVSGQTIHVLDGTFSETLLGKSNVFWHINRGVVLDGGAAAVWLLTNSVPYLRVTGEGTVTNGLLVVNGPTNGLAEIGFYDWKGGGLVNYVSGMSNRVRVSVIGESGRAGSGLPILFSNPNTGTNAFWLSVSSPSDWVSLVGQSGQNSSNCVIDIRVARFLGGANGVLNVLATVTFSGGRFSRNGYTASGVGSNVWFKGVSCTSSNTDASAAIYSGVRGTFYFENERTLINNP